MEEVMTKRDPQQIPASSTSVGASLYDIFDNPNGPSYNELWATFAGNHPIAAGKILRLANESGLQTDDPAVAEAILLGAVKVAAYCDTKSKYNPINYSNSISKLTEMFN